MTKYYANRSFRLRESPTSTKVLITLFLLMVLISYGVAIANQQVRSGHTPESIVKYYNGSEEELAFPKPMREMLSVSHVHLFGMPILLFLLCHIFDITSTRQGVKVIVFVAAFGAAMLQIIAPWLIRYVSSELALLMPASYGLLTAATLVLVGVPLWEMWLSPATRQVEVGSD